MNEFFRLALLGLGTGAIYAMLSQGAVLIHKSSGVINFAQGGFALVGAALLYEFADTRHVPRLLALVLAVAITGILGSLFHIVVLRHLHSSSSLAKITATVALMTLFQSGEQLYFGTDPRNVLSVLPVHVVQLTHGVRVGVDRLWILGIGIAMSIILWVVYSRTKFGRVTAGVADNKFSTATLGHSPEANAAINWGVGAALAGLAGCLIAPITSLNASNLVLLVIPALAAALVGRFDSFPLAFVSAMIIGIGQSLTSWPFPNNASYADALPFLVVVVTLLVRRERTITRDFVSERLPAVGSGRIRPIPVLLLVGIGVLLAFTLPLEWQTALTATAAYAIICLSLVVVTGYGGQISMAQYVLGGIASLVTARLLEHGVLPLVLAVLAGVVVGMACALLVALVTMRSRGMGLAIGSIGAAVLGYDLILNNPKYNGGTEGISVGSPSIAGWSIDPYLHAGRYAAVAVALLAVCGCVCANLRRGGIGRQLVAARSNERAATAMGVNVGWVRAYAFTCAGGVACLGSILFALLNPFVLSSQFDVVSSINFFAVTVVGSVGFVGGAVVGAFLIPGGIVTQALHGLNEINTWLPFIGSVGLLLVLCTQPSGIFAAHRDAGALLFRWLTATYRRWRPAPATAPAEDSRVAASDEPAPTTTPTVDPRRLTLTSVSVDFGGVHALKDVSLEVVPGEIHGLIGPNGAGKTTLVDVVGGSIRPTSGAVAVDDRQIENLPAHRRAELGLTRTFQSLELFDDLPVIENLAVAGERMRWRHYLTELIRPRPLRMSEAAIAAVRHFRLADVLDSKSSDLSYGQRNLVSMARAVAARPSILLLDEPAAGLSEQEAEALGSMTRSLADDYGMAVLLIDHNVNFIMSLCDRISVLAQGSVIASGSPNEVMSNPVVLNAYLGESSPAAAARGDESERVASDETKIVVAQGVDRNV